MLDRVREAMFSTLGDRVEEARALDLFAGTGSLGLEALSRGATSVRFFEKGRAMQQVLLANLELLGLSDRGELVRGSALDPGLWGSGYDLAFFDPPYAIVRDGPGRAGLLRKLVELFQTALEPHATVVFHAPRGAVRSGDFDPLLECEERIYGTSALLYLTRSDS